jgi:hypothetical protein
VNGFPTWSLPELYFLESAACQKGYLVLVLSPAAIDIESGAISIRALKRKPGIVRKVATSSVPGRESVTRWNWTILATRAPPVSSSAKAAIHNHRRLWLWMLRLPRGMTSEGVVQHDRDKL